MSDSGQFESEVDTDMELILDVNSIADILAKNPAFIRAVAQLVTVEQTKQARRVGNLYGKYAQREVPVATQNQVPGTKRIN